MSSSHSTSLNDIPHEVLEHIAFFAVRDPFLGPPSTIIPLLSTCRAINASLSITTNYHLYAQIFTYKFDLAPAIRRLGSQATSSIGLSIELRRRCFYLKRIKRRLDARVASSATTGVVEHDPETDDPNILRSTLWSAYLMMLENDGKNERQLREYAQIDTWLRQYWFDDFGASLAKSAIGLGQWPSNTQESALAMWLFWFLVKPGPFLFSFR
jgi:hypothetical protein